VLVVDEWLVVTADPADGGVGPAVYAAVGVVLFVVVTAGDEQPRPVRPADPVLQLDSQVFSDGQFGQHDDRRASVHGGLDKPVDLGTLLVRVAGLDRKGAPVHRSGEVEVSETAVGVAGGQHRVGVYQTGEGVGEAV
jgi:hypothetical protein